MTENNDYEAGLRDGRLTSLEHTVRELTADVATLKKAMWLFIGGIGAIQGLTALATALEKWPT